MDLTEGSETSANIKQTLGKHPKVNKDFEDGQDRWFRNVGQYKQTLGKHPKVNKAFEDGPDRGFRNVGQYKTDAGETPKS
jgi:hypothetical protein